LKSNELTKDKKIVKFRLIQFNSPKTFEKINVGLVIEDNNENFEILLLEDKYLKLYEQFEVFDADNLKNVINILKMKSKKNKLSSQKYKISSTIELSAVKINKKYNYEELFSKYLTLHILGKWFERLYVGFRNQETICSYGEVDIIKPCGRQTKVIFADIKECIKNRNV